MLRGSADGLNDTGMTLTFASAILTMVFSANLPHDFHVSRCEMQYSVHENSVHTSLHVFTDDLLYALTGNESAEIEQIHSVGVDSMIMSYLTQHLRLSVDASALEFVYHGKELAEDEMVVHILLSFPLNVKPKQIDISNSILLEEYGDQRNITVWKQGEERGQVFMLGKSKTEARVEVK
jgi:hypothetical protein